MKINLRMRTTLLLLLGVMNASTAISSSTPFRPKLSMGTVFHGIPEFLKQMKDGTQDEMKQAIVTCLKTPGYSSAAKEEWLKKIEWWLQTTITNIQIQMKHNYAYDKPTLKAIKDFSSVFIPTALSALLTNCYKIKAQTDCDKLVSSFPTNYKATHISNTTGEVGYLMRKYDVYQLRVMHNSYEKFCRLSNLCEKSEVGYLIRNHDVGVMENSYEKFCDLSNQYEKAYNKTNHFFIIFPLCCFMAALSGTFLFITSFYLLTTDPNAYNQYLDRYQDLLQFVHQLQQQPNSW